ncbi:hypothetical protein [Streptomyces sp. BV129]|uniref:hypothetical protein n=1 Tax=Streptomyces sp. BV129 TaxID=2849671 RepID=UPI0020C5EF55|nr:hypothetical protein [Streptomyces sp. BV129]
MSLVALLALAVTGCGSGKTAGTSDGTPTKQAMMDEKQATERAQEVVQEAVAGMSPKPSLRPTGPRPLGECLADDHSAGERLQVSLTYQLTGVPGQDAKKLVRQARDAWVKRGYEFQGPDGDWSDPFPSVSMRTVTDDFWMTALTGVLDKTKQEGLAAISVTSPCFDAEESTTTDPASFRQTVSDRQAESRAREHSSRVYDALRVPHGPAQEGEGLATYREEGDVYAHHAWSTQPITEEMTARALDRARAHFESSGWSVRHVPAATGAPGILARNPGDGSVAHLAPAGDGTLRVGVTTPAARQV